MRKGYGIFEHEDTVVPDTIRHRFKAAWVGALAKGGFHLCSIYLIDSEGLSDGNAFILSEVARFLQGLSGPWVLTGDFNMSPEDIAGTDWVSQCSATVVPPPSCHLPRQHLRLLRGLPGACSLRARRCKRG